MSSVSYAESRSSTLHRSYTNNLSNGFIFDIFFKKNMDSKIQTNVLNHQIIFLKIIIQ
jgi:hypothetical protein